MEILGGWKKQDGIFQEDQQLCKGRRMALRLYRALVSCQQQYEPQPYIETMNSTVVSQLNQTQCISTQKPQKEQQPTKTNEIISSNTSNINSSYKMVNDSLHIMIQQSLFGFQRAVINQFQRQERYITLLQGKITKMEASLRELALELMKREEGAKIDRFGQINYVRELQVGMSKLQRRQQDLKQQIRGKQTLIIYQEQKIKQLEGLVCAKEKQLRLTSAEISQLKHKLMDMKEQQSKFRPSQTVADKSSCSKTKKKEAQNYADYDSIHPKGEHSLLEGIAEEGKECGIMPVTYNTIAKRAAQCTRDDPSGKDKPSELTADKLAGNNFTTQKLTNRKIQLQNVQCQNQTTQKKRHFSAVSDLLSPPGHNMPVSTVNKYHFARTIQTPYYKDIVVLEQEEPSLLSSRSSEREEIDGLTERFPRRNLDFESHENKFLSSLEYSCLQQSHVQHFDLPESSFYPSTPLEPSPLYQSLIDNQLSSYLPLSPEEQYLLTEIQQLKKRITGNNLPLQNIEQTLPQPLPTPSQQISLLNKKLSIATLECQQLRQQCWTSNQKENELIRLLTNVKKQLSQIKAQTQQLLPCQICTYLLQQSH